MHVSEVERDLLKKKTKYVVEAEKTNEDEDLEDQNLDTLVLKKKKKNIPSNLKDRPQFKRNKAKVLTPQLHSLFIIILILCFYLHY